MMYQAISASRSRSFARCVLVGAAPLVVGCGAEAPPVGTTSEPITVCEQADGAPCPSTDADTAAATDADAGEQADAVTPDP
jgi:hypothetical protein